MAYKFTKEELLRIFELKFYSKDLDREEKTLALSFFRSNTSTISDDSSMDKGSCFDIEKPHFKYLRKTPLSLFKIIVNHEVKKKGYGSLILFSKGIYAMNGFTLFQEHSTRFNNLFEDQKDSELHIFAMKRKEIYKGWGTGPLMARTIIQYAREAKVEYIRFGKNNKKMTDLLSYLKSIESKINVEVLPPSFYRGANFIRVL